MCILLICVTAIAGWEWVSPTLGSDHYYGIWGTTEDDLYIAGASEILHWDGESLDPVFVDKGARIHDIFGFDQDNIFLVAYKLKLTNSS